MKSLRMRVFLDLLVNVYTLAPGVTGVALILLSKPLGAFAAFIGLAALAMAVMGFLYNAMFNYGSIIEQAAKEDLAKETKRKNAEWDELHWLLTRNEDRRPLEDFVALRKVYETFVIDLRNGKIKGATPSIASQIDAGFEAVCRYLRAQHEMANAIKDLKGDVRNRLEAKRGLKLDEIKKSAELLTETMVEVRGLGYTDNDTDLARIRTRLEAQLGAARDFDREMSGEGDFDNFKEYLPEKTPS